MVAGGLRVNSTSSCARLTLIQFKVLHRTHLSKAKLNKLFSTSDTCDIMLFIICQSHAYFFVLSPVSPVQSWAMILIADTLSKALNKPVVPSPLTSIFSVPEEFTSFTNKESNVIAFASLVARRRILLHWKDNKPPPPSSKSW